MILSVLALVLLLVHSCTSAQTAMPPTVVFPPALGHGSWLLEDSAVTYSGMELFRLIDGGAPLYFEYGFTEARTARYRGINGGTVAAEVYGMRTEGGAFGLYSYLAAGSGVPAKVGWKGTQGTGFVLAWEGRQSWSFTALDSTDPESLLVLARDLAGPPSRSWGLPVECAWFAAAFPEARDAVLFFGPLGFQKRTLSLPERILGVRQGMSGVIPGAEVVMFEYSSREEAGMRRDSLLWTFGFDVSADPRGPQFLRVNGDELLVAEAGKNCLVILRGGDRGRLMEVWRGVLRSESLRGR